MKDLNRKQLHKITDNNVFRNIFLERLIAFIRHSEEEKTGN